MGSSLLALSFNRVGDRKKNVANPFSDNVQQIVFARQYRAAVEVQFIRQ